MYREELGAKELKLEKERNEGEVCTSGTKPVRRRISGAVLGGGRKER